jgi:hypothetical protein
MREPRSEMRRRTLLDGRLAISHLSTLDCVVRNMSARGRAFFAGSPRQSKMSDWKSRRSLASSELLASCGDDLRTVGWSSCD